MSVCDAKILHSIYGSYLANNIQAKAPKLGFDSDIEDDFNEFKKLFLKHHTQLAGVILEPVVQGAGGMRIYNPKFITKVYELCKEYDVLFIADEIAQGLVIHAKCLLVNMQILLQISCV